MTYVRRIFIPAMAAIGVLSGYAYSGNTQLPNSTSVPVVNQTNTDPSPPFLVAQNRSLPENQVLVAPATSGGGFLKVANGTNRDAYIKLVAPNSRTLLAAFYVKSNSSFTLERIPDGTYQVLFMLGTNWNPQAQLFTKSKRVAKFNQSLGFATTQLGNEIRYPGFQITLHPVVDGNTRTSGVSEQEFSRY